MTAKLKSILIINLLIVSIVSPFSFLLAQDSERTRQLKEFAAKTVDYQEGFVCSTPGNDFSYHSFRNDISDALLTRCTDGTVAIEWKTESVYDKLGDNGAGFIWMAALDLISEYHEFDVFVDGIKRFTINSSMKEQFELKNPDGGSLRFITAETDRYADAHGYMALWAPSSWLKAGKTLSIKICGHSENSNCWIIIYKATDASKYLHESVRYNSWLNMALKAQKGKLLSDIELPKDLVGQNIDYKINGKTYSLPVTLKNEAGFASIETKGSLEKIKSLIVSDKYGEMLNVSNLVTGKTTRLANLALLESNIINLGDNLTINASRVYKPNTVRSLNTLSNSNLSGGSIYLMNSSHQDIAWMDSPEKCILLRDTMLLSPLVEHALKDPSYKFDIEDALMLREYITRHPNMKDTIGYLLNSGRLSCGASYIQPYEEMQTGEALARQFYFGSRWLKKTFGYDARTYWNQDVPGRTLQMAQILSKSEVPYLSLSRMKKGIFNWYSPDGSFVSVYSAGHYGDAYSHLQKNYYESAEYIARSSGQWSDYFSKSPKNPAIPLLSDWDMSPAKDYSKLIAQWNSTKEIQDSTGKYVPIHLPEIKPSLFPDFMKDFISSANQLPKISGERPDVWLFIHGPTHQKAILDSREADHFLTAAEKFATANALIDNSYYKYPSFELEQAWEARIYPDHGWGGKHGDITDDLFASKYAFARSKASEVLQTTLKDISSKIKIDNGKGLPLVVFNSLNWIRNDLATSRVSFPDNFGKWIKVEDASGKSVPLQLENPIFYPSGSIQSADISFLASDVPSIGYKTYYLKADSKPVSKTLQSIELILENSFYKLSLGNGGIEKLYDKELGKDILDSKKFKGAEVFTLHSEGTGAGEFADVQQPDMEGFDKASNYKAEWKLNSDGPVYQEYSCRQPIRNAMVEQRIRLYNAMKRIDVRIDLLNYEGVLYREYRMAIPVAQSNATISYEVPYGVVTIGKDELQGAAGERYTTDCKDIHPRGIENWIDCSGKDFGITMSSSVAVADYIDPSDQTSENPLIQPIMISSRRSCHEEGNEYLQTGDHHFFFSLNTHKPGWEYGYRTALQANEPLQVITNFNTYVSAILPEEKSFFTIDDPMVLMTTVKKAEDQNAGVFRLVNLDQKSRLLKLGTFMDFKKASQTNLIENKTGFTYSIDKKLINIELGKFSIESILIE